MSETQWILESNGCYFEKWVAIGPLCTNKIEMAHRYASRLDAIHDTTRHCGLLLYEPIEVPASQPASCPWCKSRDKALRLEVPGFRMGCYNDWHIPLCKNCGKGLYSHGHEWGCQRYEAVEEVAALTLDDLNAQQEGK